MSLRKSPARNLRRSPARPVAAAEALDLAFAALSVGRDNKALLLAVRGRIVRANELAVALYGDPGEELAGRSIVPDCLEREPTLLGDESPRWITHLCSKGGPIEVEVMRQRLLQNVYAYAVRDLRVRRQQAEQEEIQHRTLRERDDEIRAQNLRFEIALTSLSSGVCVFDAQQRLVICNEPYRQLYGLSPQEVAPGTTLNAILHQRIDRNLMAGSRPDAFLRERQEVVTAHKPALCSHVLPDGRVVEVGHHPIPGGGWVATHEDVTERKRIERELEQSNQRLEAQNRRMQAQEEELRTQNAKLDAALSNMFQGLAMFDSEQRLVIANDRFAALYGMSMEQVKPGTHLRSIIEHRIASGAYVGTTAEEVLRRMRERVGRGTVSHMTSRMGDGRTIAVSIWPRPDGGWVTTHQDMTEREKLKEQLELQNSLLVQREEELKTQNARFGAAVNNMGQGLCLFDAQQRVLLANRQFAEIYGLDPARVQAGTSLEAILRARVRTGLYRHLDAEQFVRDGIASFGDKVSQIVRLADGRAISVLRLPMPDGGLVSTHEDITEREMLNAKLARQHEQLDAALENMLHGVAMFDAGQRLIVCNRRYAEMYRLSSEQVKPGTTVREIFEYRCGNGCYQLTDQESFVGSWTDSFGEISSRVQELADGRIINITRRGMANGGRLVTHEDITDRHRLNAQLQSQHHLLKEQEALLKQRNLQLDAALANMVQGLCMFDANHRVLIANTQYAEMYGLSAEDVGPGTTLRHILERRIDKGLCPHRNVEELLDATVSKMSGESSAHFVTRLHNGREIAVSAQRMAEGGVVTTHQDITEQRQAEAKITHMALHDALTALPNRTLLNQRLERAIARSKRGEIGATHLLDLDHFKAVNDSLGHAAGDKLLCQVASRLSTLIREIDTVARMGGDEFAIVQSNIAGPADATSLALRVIAALSAPYQIDDQQVVIGVSVGIALCDQACDSAEQMLRNADLALYRSKDEGRGTFCFFEDAMDAETLRKRSLERDLRKALAGQQFELHYQPLVDVASQQISGFEALLRWHHPEMGSVLPAAFIGLAEETGLIIPIGEWTIRQACTAAAKWPNHLTVAINLSAVQLRSPGLLPVIFDALSASGLAAERLEIEITESVLLEDGETTLDLLYQLRSMGIRIAMDDFGTGYSSLSYLQSFPFDKIKIDRSFIKDVAESTSALNIVRAISALAKGLGMAATAEGVETQEQLDAIKSEGCTEMQGYLFSRPLPESEIDRLLFPRQPNEHAIAS